MVDILIIMNNYFHDVATATLLGATVIMWVPERRSPKGVCRRVETAAEQNGALLA